MADDRSFDQTIEDDDIAKLQAMKEAMRLLDGPGAMTRGSGTGNDEARRRRGDNEARKRACEMAQDVRHARNDRNRDRRGARTGGHGRPVARRERR